MIDRTGRAMKGGWGRTMEDSEKGYLENSHQCCRIGASVSHPGSTCRQWLAWKEQWTVETDEVGDDRLRVTSLLGEDPNG